MFGMSSVGELFPFVSGDSLTLDASTAAVRGVLGLGEATGRLPESCRWALPSLTGASLWDTAREALSRCRRATKCSACM